MKIKINAFTRKILCIAGTVLSIFLMVLATILCFSIKWMFDTWSNLTMEEMVFHLTAPLEGTNTGMIIEYINVCIVPAVLILLAAMIIFITLRGNKKYFVFMAFGTVFALAVCGINVRAAWNKLDVGGYAESQGTYSTFIDDNYVSTADVSLTFPERKRNLIYIFLESMETTYADKKSGGAFEKNVIPELTVLAQENEDFSGESEELNGGYSMPGTTWTMGAMFAQTAGLPLSTSLNGNDMDTQDTFFSGVMTLGDVLEQAGYSQTLLIGSDATFGGRRLYFSEHGNYDFIDYNYAHDNGLIPEDYNVWWGYEDEKLFGFAKEKILELASQDNPFNLTLLTVDTHFEDGYVCEQCPDTYGDDQYANVMACSSYQVNEFVKWIQEQPFYENTTIVLVGDHPTMDSDFCKGIDSEYVRRVYTSYINVPVEVKENATRNYTTFDMFPTTLASLGVKIEGNRLGLGTNLFSTTQTLTERYGREKVKEEVSRKSEMMEELADIDAEKPELLARTGVMPAAEIWTEAYRKEEGAFLVEVTDIVHMRSELDSVALAVWTGNDQSDMQWIRMEPDGEGNYYADINIANFGYVLGDYHIEAYVIDQEGGQYMVGSTMNIAQ